MIDLSKLSSKELRELEKQIEEHKKTRKDLEGWKITFTIRYNPFKTLALTKDRFGDDTIGDLMANEIANLIIRQFCLSAPEDVSGCDVVEATQEEISW
jgi:hypothetical protein